MNLDAEDMTYHGKHFFSITRQILALEIEYSEAFHVLPCAMSMESV